jgi:hypothetical protein
MVYCMMYITVYTMVYTVIYTFVCRESYMDGLLNRHSWDITRYWYWKITQQYSEISSFKSRQVVTKFSQGIPHPSTLSAACTASRQCIIVVIPVPITPICPILLSITVPTVLRNGGEYKLASLCSMTSWKWQQLCSIQPRQKCYRCYIPWYIPYKQVYTMVYTIQTVIYHGIYHCIYHGIYHCIYHGIYYLSGTWTCCCLTVYTMVYTSFLVYTMVYTVVRVLYTMVYTSLTCSCLTVYTNLDGI